MDAYRSTGTRQRSAAIAKQGSHTHSLRHEHRKIQHKGKRARVCS
eukprot:COSAG04_NODE_20991_length_382_cov_0.720848_1_plen_44_part_10